MPKKPRKKKKLIFDMKNLIATFNCWELTEKYEIMVLFDTEHGKYRAFCNDKMCKSLYDTPEAAKKRAYGMILGDVEIKKIEIGQREVIR